MKYKLQDLIDMEHFQSLQDRLNKIYSFPSSIIDNDGNILTATAWQDVCTKFHRTNKNSERDCIKSDQYIRDHLHEANPAVSYLCPHGLVDNAMPIIIDGIHYGNFFTGQFFLDEPDLAFFRTQAQKYGFDEDAYLDAVKKVPIWTQEQLNNYLFFIKGLIAVISESGLKKLKEIENRKLIEISEKRHRSILKSAMDGYWLTDTEGRLLEVNDAYCRMSGYNEDELLNMQVSDLEAVEDPQLVAEHMKKVISLGSDRFGSKHCRKDGTVFDVEVSIQFRSEESGQCVCFLRDITERKQAEKVMARLQGQFSNALEMAHLGPWEYNVDNDLFTFNDHFYKIFRTTAERVEGYNMSSAEYARRFVHPDDVSLVGEETRKAIETTDPNFRRQLEHKIIYADGTVGHLSVSFFIVKDDKGKTIKTYGVNQDITERKKMEEDIRQLQKMESIGTLAGGIAHDFNNILFPIVGHAEMLIEDNPEDSPLRESLNEIYAGALRARDLVQQILAFSRQGTSELKLMKMQPIIKEALKLIRSTIPTTISISQNLQSDCGVVEADPTQIHQIVMNLATNAYHAMEENGGELKVTLKEIQLGGHELITPDMMPGSYACLTIADTGVGMDKKVIDRIFEPFFTTKRKGKGTGMGLSVVHGIVKGMNGAIKVYSEPGQGTQFHIYLPIIKSSFETQEIQIKEPLKGGTEKVLLVDDEMSIIAMERQALRRLGYQVASCTSSIEALEAFRNDPDKFDIVISDMTMPKMTGDKLAVELIKIRHDIPILICTGFSESMSEEKIESMGVKGLLLKPIIIKDLAKKIREVLDKKNEI